MDVKSVKKGIERDVSRLITQDFYNAAKGIMNQFYDYYSPDFYDRTDALRRSVAPTWGNTYGGVNINIENGYKDYTMWESGIRGLPPEYKGFVDLFYANIPEFGILATNPHEAMTQLEQVWENKRQGEVDKIVEGYLDQLDFTSMLR